MILYYYWWIIKWILLQVVMILCLSEMVKAILIIKHAHLNMPPVIIENKVRHDSGLWEGLKFVQSQPF